MWPTYFPPEMYPTLPPAGPYGTLVVSAVVIGQLVALDLARRMGLDRTRLAIVSAVAVLVGFMGAKVLYFAAAGGPWSWSGGFAFYGGLLGGALGVVLGSLALRLPVFKVLDIGALVIVLGHGIGRVGCFFAGCCHGVAVPGFGPVRLARHVPLVRFPAGEVHTMGKAPWLATVFDSGTGTHARIVDVLVYPTQLWLAAGSLVLAGVLAWLWRRRPFDGAMVALTLVVEPVLRASVELFRGDERGYAVSWQAGGWFPGAPSAGEGLQEGLVGLTTSQAIAVVLVLTGLGVWARQRSRGVAPEPRWSSAVADEYDPLMDG